MIPATRSRRVQGRAMQNESISVSDKPGFALRRRGLALASVTVAAFASVVALAFASTTYYVGNSGGGCGNAAGIFLPAEGGRYETNFHRLNQNRNSMRFCESLQQGLISSWNGNGDSESRGTFRQSYGGGANTLLAVDFSTRYVYSGCGGYNTARGNSVSRRCAYNKP